MCLFSILAPKNMNKEGFYCSSLVSMNELTYDLDLFDQGEMESASFGLGKSGVLEALALQKAKVSNISKFQEDIDSVLSSDVSCLCFYYSIESRYRSVYLESVNLVLRLCAAIMFYYAAVSLKEI